MLNFCTVFDLNYLSRGLTMYKSLLRNCSDFKLYIVCLDQKLYDILLKNNYQHIEPIQLYDLEKKYPELLVVKDSRSYVEYIFTLSPVIALYIFESYHNVDLITTIDADLYFFSDPSNLINNGSSIAITPHNFKSGYRKHVIYGKYNVSFQSFKKDEFGLLCLRKWKSDCIEWCYDKYDGSRYADQKYLDSWFEDYSNIIEYGEGAGIAPWNIKNNDLSISGNGTVMINNQPIIYYHFHGLRNISDSLYSIGLVDYRVGKRKKIIKLLYKPYISELYKNSSLKSNISRRMHPKLGRFIYLTFLADLYIYRNEKLKRVYNLSFMRMLYSYLKSLMQ